MSTKNLINFNLKILHNDKSLRLFLITSLIVLLYLLFLGLYSFTNFIDTETFFFKGRMTLDEYKRISILFIAISNILLISFLIRIIREYVNESHLIHILLSPQHRFTMIFCLCCTLTIILFIYNISLIFLINISIFFELGLFLFSNIILIVFSLLIYSIVFPILLLLFSQIFYDEFKGLFILFFYLGFSSIGKYFSLYIKDWIVLESIIKIIIYPGNSYSLFLRILNNQFVKYDELLYPILFTLPLFFLNVVLFKKRDI